MAKTTGVKSVLSAMPSKLSNSLSRKYQGLGSGNNAVRATGGKPTRKGR